MNQDPNSNFLDNGEEIEYEEVPEDQLGPEDEVLDEIEGEVVQQERVAAQTMKALSEAEKRIEQANLYKAILNASLFGPNSARPEIIAIVDKEFKEFVMYRLEVLLGIRADGGGLGRASAKSDFSAQEVQALKAMAGRLISKGQSSPQPVQPQVVPVVQAVGTQEPAAIEVAHVQAPSAPQPRMVRRVVKRTVNGVEQPKAKTRSRRPKSNNVSTVTGEDLSQAVSTTRPPVPMPTQAAMDMMNANQAARNARATGASHSMMAQALTQVLKSGGVE